MSIPIDKASVISSASNNQSSNFWYNEGTEKEKIILEVLDKAKDVSALSEELHSQIVDWSTESHFSKYRNSLLLPFKELFTEKSVLEIGAGFGGLTRLLGECAKEVYAVEPPLIRALGCAKRCRGLRNVKVIAEDIFNLYPSKKFDFVVVVGVLEYAALMKNIAVSPSPASSFIHTAASFLKDDGVLILAIENRLGLRYFVPLTEDHTSLFLESLHNFPNKKGPKTFSRKELINLFNENNLRYQEWFFPFPDYKTPFALFHHPLQWKNTTDLSHFLFKEYSRDYYRAPIRIIDEFLLLSEFFKNDLLESFSNSFLVFASKGKKNLPKADWVIKRYQLSRSVNRQSEISIGEKDKELKVRKKYLYGKKKALYQDLYPEPYIFSFMRAALSENFKGEWVALFSRFYQFLQRHTDPKGFIGHRYYEATLSNVSLVHNKFVYFDVENIKRKPIPLLSVFLRNVAYLFSMNLPHLYKIYDRIPCQNAIVDFLRESTGIVCTQNDIENFIEEESAYQHILTKDSKKRILENIQGFLQQTIKNQSNLLELVKHCNVEDVMEKSLSAKKLTELEEKNRNLSSKIIRLREDMERITSTKLFKASEKIRRIKTLFSRP